MSSSEQRGSLRVTSPGADIQVLDAYLQPVPGASGVGAVILAEKVAEQPGNLPAAFKAYEQARYLRTARVQIMARVYGDFYHARGVTAELRDTAVGSRTTQQAYDGIAWLYGGP